MSLANVVCMIWTINQILTACLGKQCQMEEGLQSPIQMASGGKEGGKEQWKECLWYWNNFTYVYSKLLKIYIDLHRSWCWGGIKSAFHVVLSSLIFFPRHLTTTQFRNLSEPSCLLLKQSKCALTLPAKQQQPPQSCTKFREFCTSGFANVCDVCPDVYLEKVEAYSACLCIVVADFNFGTVQ